MFLHGMFFNGANNEINRLIFYNRLQKYKKAQDYTEKKLNADE